MHISQLALAVIHDRSTEDDRARAFRLSLMTSRPAAVLTLMPAVYAELDKPIYDGVTFTNDKGEDASCWEAGEIILQAEIDRAMVFD
jgi:hypothetical protein